MRHLAAHAAPRPPGIGAPRGRERGIMLVTVLWIVAILGLVVSAFNGNVRTGIAIRKNEIAMARIEALTRGALMLAAARIQLGGEDRWEPDGRNYRATLGDARLDIAVTDANGLLDINLAERDLLEAILGAASGSPDAAAQIAAFIMAKRAAVATGTKAADQPATTIPSSPDRGGRANPEARPGRSTTPAFRDLSQLDGAPAMTRRLSTALERWLTVFGRTSRINPATAPQEVLAAVPGLNPADAAAIVNARSSQTERDALIARLEPASQQHLSQERGPAFKVDITVRHPDVPSPVRRSAVILVDKDDTAGIRILQPLAERNS